MDFSCFSYFGVFLLVKKHKKHQNKKKQHQGETSNKICDFYDFTVNKSDVFSVFIFSCRSHFFGHMANVL